jgi:hypothetical protein
MLMQESTTLSAVLATLGQQARALGLTDTEWAARAGVRKETLSRLRRRETCDFSTLRTLAKVVGMRVGVLETRLPGTVADGHFPAALSREYEEQLVELCASGSLDPERWSRLGPRFFMAGLAVLCASVQGLDRRGLLDLAERLHPGASAAAAFALWLERSPVRATRFVPLLEAEHRRAA